MNWTQLKVKCTHSSLDEVCAIMSMVDNGLMIEDYSDIEENLMPMYGELIDDSILNADKDVCDVSIFIPEVKSIGDAIAFIKERFTCENIDAKITLEGVDEQDWENAWRKYYKPLKIGNTLVVVPAWEEYCPGENEIIIKMDPGMAFGTGTHETTRLCAAMLEKYIKKGDRVLDVGTGSGILSLFASKLGAKSINAYDIDPVAVKVARENAEDNGVTNVSCAQSDLLASVDRKEKYTLALANIVSDILIRMSKDINEYLADGAYLICSGIIDERAQDVKDAMSDGGLICCDEDGEAGWKVIVFKKNG